MTRSSIPCIFIGNEMEGGVGIAVLVRPNSSTIGFRSDQLLLTNSSVLAGSVIDGERIQASIYVPELVTNSKIWLVTNTYCRIAFGYCGIVV